MIYDITKYGAKAQDDFFSTEAIQSALDACHKAGGGLVLVPAGTYRTGSIQLYSDIELHLESGASLIGPDNCDKYTKLPYSWELYPYTMTLIYAENAKNVKISGTGKIDFNARAFALHDKICTGLPEEKRGLLTDELLGECHYEMPPREKRPSRLIFFNECENVEISGITLVDSPTWTIVFNKCNKILTTKLRIDNDLRVSNCDGIHCCGCRDVIISDCNFTCGDDCIALTGISDYNETVENVLISNCIFSSASAAVRIGFLASKVKNILINNLIIRNSNRGIAIFAGEDGTVSNVKITNLIVDTHIFAGPWWGKGEALVLCAAHANSLIEDISVNGVTVSAENSTVIYGVNKNIRNVRLHDWNIRLSYGKARPLYGSSYDLAPHQSFPAPDARKELPWLYVEGVEQPATENIRVTSNHEEYEFSTKEIVK